MKYSDIDMLESVVPTPDYHRVLKIIRRMGRVQRMIYHTTPNSMFERMACEYIDKAVTIVEDAMAHYEMTQQQGKLESLWNAVESNRVYW